MVHQRTNNEDQQQKETFSFRYGPSHVVRTLSRNRDGNTLLRAPYKQHLAKCGSEGKFTEEA